MNQRSSLNLPLSAAIVLGLTLLLTAGVAAHTHKDVDVRWEDHEYDGRSMDFDGTTLVITNERYDERVEITEDYELFIDGRKITTDAAQKELLQEYYEVTDELVKEAKRIGVEGAAIGLKGAALGVKALGCVFKLASPNYDTDDLEAEIEGEAEKIEAKAEKLEAKAAKLEDMVDDLDDIADDMVEQIPELDDLGWF